MNFNLLLVLFTITSTIIYVHAHTNITSDVVLAESQALSRRKRFIIFDEGSSLQLVFCLTYPTIFEIGDIFLWGYTSALAYELPQDPYSPFRHHADPLHRRMDSKTIYYLNEDGKIIDNKPYKRKFIVNPAMAKRSVDVFSPNEMGPFKKRARVENTPLKMDRKRVHEKQQELFGSANMDAKTVEFHRSSRSGLYSKIETMLNGLGGNGRACLLRTLCLVGQTRGALQGSFFQEILKAVFTLPKSASEDHLLHYDIAYNSKESCDVLYPGCQEGLADPPEAKFAYKKN